MKFDVQVIGYNIDTFEEYYSQYITNKEILLENSECVDFAKYTLDAPKDIYYEIENLIEECITIV